MQDPLTSSPADTSAVGALGWFDLTALVILLVFVVLGLLRGFGWQCCRLLTLVLAFATAALWGDAVGHRIEGWFAPGIDARVPIYVGCISVFVAALVVLSLLAFLIEQLRREEPEVTMSSRMGGALLGFGTGGFVVLALLTAVLMFFGPQTALAAAAQRSRSLAASQGALGALGGLVPAPWREVLGVQDVEGTGAPATGGR